MAGFTIDELRELPDYAQVTKWDINFVTLPAVGALAFPLTGGLNLRCESVELPKTTMQKIEIQTRGHKVHQAGIMDYSSQLTITFSETVDSQIALFIKAWRELCWSTRQGASVAKQDYQAEIMITLNDNQDNPRLRYIVYGCFLEDYDPGTVDGSTSDVMKPSMTLSFDYFNEQPLI